MDMSDLPALVQMNEDQTEAGTPAPEQEAPEPQVSADAPAAAACPEEKAEVPEGPAVPHVAEAAAVPTEPTPAVAAAETAEEPPVYDENSDVKQGVVKNWNLASGWGFVTYRQAGKFIDAYVHTKQIGRKRLVPGQPVSFRVAPLGEYGKPWALDLEGPGVKQDSVCHYFNTSTGCKFGASCQLMHVEEKHDTPEDSATLFSEGFTWAKKRPAAAPAAAAAAAPSQPVANAPESVAAAAPTRKPVSYPEAVAICFHRREAKAAVIQARWAEEDASRSEEERANPEVKAARNAEMFALDDEETRELNEMMSAQEGAAPAPAQGANAQPPASRDTSSQERVASGSGGKGDDGGKGEQSRGKGSKAAKDGDGGKGGKGTKGDGPPRGYEGKGHSDTGGKQRRSDTGKQGGTKGGKGRGGGYDDAGKGAARGGRGGGNAHIDRWTDDSGKIHFERSGGPIGGKAAGGAKGGKSADVIQGARGEITKSVDSSGKLCFAKK